MRYRPFNQSGLAVSAITLTMSDGTLSAADRMALVFAALEAGVNSFELACLSPDCTAALRAAVDAAGRNVLVLTLRPPGLHTVAEGGAASTLETEVRACLEQIGVQRFDAVLVDAVPGAAAAHDHAAILHAVRAQGLARMVGVSCDRDGPGFDILHSGFDVLATPFGLRTDAGMRKRLRAMVDRNITLIGYDYDDMVAPPAAAAEPKGLSRLFRRPAVEPGADPYEFLRRTPDWTAEEISLAYALTEPLLATIRVRPTDVATLNLLATAAERELPAGSSAQIEMARFAAPA